MSKSKSRTHLRVLQGAPRRNLFDHEGHYTEEGLACYSEILAAVIPVFTRLLNEGYSPRDIASVIITTTVELQNHALSMKPRCP